MERRNFEFVDDLEDTEDFDEYSMTLQKDVGDIKFKERPKKWSSRDICKLFLAVVAISSLIYFLGSWIMYQFNHYMGLFTHYMVANPKKGILIYSVLFICGMQIFIPPGTFITCTTMTFMKMFGNVEGILIHFCVVWVTEHIGIFVTYFIGRYFCRIGDILAQRIEHFDTFNHLVASKGAKITFLLRL